MSLSTTHGLLLAQSAFNRFYVTYDNAAGLTATHTQLAIPFQAPRSENISKIVVAFGTCSSAQSITCKIYSDSSGAPGSQVGSGSGTATPATNTSSQFTLSSVAAVTRGTRYWIHLSWTGSSGTCYVQTDSNPGDTRAHYRTHNGAWVKQWGMPHAAIANDSDVYRPIGINSPFHVATSIAYTSFNSGTTPDEKANYIKFPFKVTVGGFALGIQPISTSSNLDVILYDGTTALETYTFDFAGTYGNPGGPCWISGYFATPRTFEANTAFRLAVKPGATGVAHYEFGAYNQGVLSILACGGDWYYSQRTDAGAWSDTTTKCIAAIPIIEAADEGAAAGALMVARGFNGGYAA